MLEARLVPGPAGCALSQAVHSKAEWMRQRATTLCAAQAAPSVSEFAPLMAPATPTGTLAGFREEGEPSVSVGTPVAGAQSHRAHSEGSAACNPKSPTAPYR